MENVDYVFFICEIYVRYSRDSDAEISRVNGIEQVALFPDTPRGKILRGIPRDFLGENSTRESIRTNGRINGNPVRNPDLSAIVGKVSRVQ